MSGSLTWEHPWVLWGLMTIPALFIWLLAAQRRYWQDALAFSQLSVLQHLRQVKHPVAAQRILPGLLLLVLAISIVGLAGPQWKTVTVSRNTYLVLALDISYSMEARDLAPNRLTAAKNAAIRFTRNLPDDVRMGLVFFAGNTFLVSPPVTDHGLLVQYLQSLQMSDLRQGTAIGDAVLTALDSLQTVTRQSPLPPGPNASKTSRPSVPGAVILLTDGESNLGVSPMTATEAAVEQQVKVFPVGIGEESGDYVRGGIFTKLDEPTLIEMARLTDGQYFRVRQLKDFEPIYRQIGEKALGLEEKKHPLMPWCLGASTLLVLTAFGWGIRQRRF